MLLREWTRLKGRVIYSLAGLKEAWAREHSFRFWAYINAISIALVLWLPIDAVHRLPVICFGLLILSAECFNTAIERVVDQHSKDHTPLGKAAKDVGSAGVAITAVVAGVAWAFAIWTLI